MKQNEVSIFRIIGLTSKHLGVYINDKLSSHGVDLTRNQYVLLKVLLEKEGSTQNDLAFLTERDKTSMARLVNCMENKGLLKKVTGEKDHRKRRIYPTSEGKALLKRATPLMKELELELIKDIDALDMQTTINVLKSVQAKVMGGAPVST